MIEQEIDTISKDILTLQHKVERLDDLPTLIERTINDALIKPNQDIHDMKREQERNSQFVAKVMKIIIAFSVIGAIATVFAIAQLSLDDLVNLITGRIPKP